MTEMLNKEFSRRSFVKAGGAMIVVRKGASRVWRVQAVSDDISEAKATVVGAVLNSY